MTSHVQTDSGDMRAVIAVKVSRLSQDRADAGRLLGGAVLAVSSVSYAATLQDATAVAPATLTPADKNLDVELVDSKFEDGATWTAKASVPLEDAKDGAKVSLKRAWTW